MECNFSPSGAWSSIGQFGVIDTLLPENITGYYMYWYVLFLEQGWIDGWEFPKKMCYLNNYQIFNCYLLGNLTHPDGIPVSGWNSIFRMEFRFPDGIAFSGWNCIFQMEFHFPNGILVSGWNSGFRMEFDFPFSIFSYENFLIRITILPIVWKDWTSRWNSSSRMEFQKESEIWNLPKLWKFLIKITIWPIVRKAWTSRWNSGFRIGLELPKESGIWWNSWFVQWNGFLAFQITFHILLQIFATFVICIQISKNISASVSSWTSVVSMEPLERSSTLRKSVWCILTEG